MKGRGLRLLTARQLNNQIHPWWRPFLTGTDIGGIVIPREHESGILVTGDTGSGKTFLTRAVLRQIRQRKQPAVIVDRHREYVQEFYDPVRDRILNPFDLRTDFWSPRLEVETDSDADLLAASLIRNSVRDDEKDRLFQGSARSILAELFKRLPPNSEPSEIFDILRVGAASVQARLKGTSADGLIDSRNINQSSWILGKAVQASSPFRYLPVRNRCAREWSARTWAPTPDGWLFLTSDATQRAAIDELQGIWIDSIIHRLLATPIGGQRVWLIIDELASLGYQGGFEEALTEGRKREVGIMACVQNIAQLQTIYGPTRTKTLASTFKVKVILRVDDPDTAQWASELIDGYEEVDSNDIARMHRLVLPAEVKGLQPLQGYIAIAGHDRSRIIIPPVGLRRHQPEFVPGEAAPAKPQTQATEPEKPKKVHGNTRHGFTVGGTETKEYQAWKQAKNRTTNPRFPDYKYYGGAIPPILMWEGWLNDPEAFVKEIGPCERPYKRWSCGRKDNKIGYFPGNIEWQTAKTQNNNKGDRVPEATSAADDDTLDPEDDDGLTEQ